MMFLCVFRKVESLAECCLESGFAAIVNCCGMAAKQLCGDASMVPVFGQVLRIECPAIQHWYRDSAGPHSIAYVYPRTKDVIFGGTKQEVRFSDIYLRIIPAFG
jgi:D-amino-acid oxidase